MLKVGGWHCRNDEEYSDDYSFLLWCHKRLLKYGARSVQMKGLPLVYEVCKATLTARMGELLPIYARGEWLRSDAMMACGNWTGSGAGKALCPATYALLKKHFKGSGFDDHVHNVMYCPVREEYVISDPFSHNATRIRPPYKKASSSWKPKYGPH